MNLTPVVFTFYTPQGEPVGETDFTIQLIRPGFDQQVGVVFPETIYMTTDSSGSATVMLAPSNTPYFVKVDGPEFCSQLSYRFYVVESDVPVNFQDLIDMGQLNPVDVTQEIIRLILEAKVHSAQSALEAKISAAAALVSELSAKDFEIASKQNELASKAFAEAAQLAQVAAQGHVDSALASKNAAKVSETNAKASETAAAGSAFTATTKASEASASASAAKASELLAAGSEQRTTSLKDSVEATNVIVQQTKSDMEALYAQALLIGSGWSPVMRVVADGSRYVLQVTDWTGGKGTKPAVGYMGATGIVAAIGSASDIRGAKGIDGTSFQVNATGTLAGRDAHNAKPAGFAYLATDNGLLYIREGASGWSPGIPFGKGDKGDTGDRGPQGIQGVKGDTGATGATNKLTIGTVTTGPTSSATITGTAPNQTLSLTLQKGDKGDTGDTGLGFTQAQYEKLDGIEAGAQKNVPTNLTRTGHTEFSMNIASSTGSLANIPRASTTLSGLMAASDQVKLNGAAPLASPSFTGTPVAPTPVAADSSTKIATTAFVQGLVTSAGSALNMDNATAGVLAVVRGGTGVTTSTGSGSTVLSISPALGGTPTAPTAATTTNTTQIATTAFVNAVNVADTGSAATALKLKTARTIALTGAATGTATAFDGSGNIAIPVTALNAANLTAGTVPNARMTGTYDGLTLKLNGNNTVFADASPGNSHALMRTVYGLASYRSNVSPTKGAIVFTAPNALAAIMHNLQITVMDWNSFSSVDILAQGYRANASMFERMGHVNSGSNSAQVRWGIDAAGKTCVILGDETTAWSYPAATIASAVFSHTGTADTYCVGWTANLLTDLSGITLFDSVEKSSSGSSLTLGQYDKFTKAEEIAGNAHPGLLHKQVSHSNFNDLPWGGSWDAALLTWGFAGERPQLLANGTQLAYRSNDAGPGTVDSWQPWRHVAFLDSPTFTDTPSAPTAATNTNTTQLATTAFVQAVNIADTGSAATAVKLKTARNLSISGGVTAAAKPFDGSGNVDLVVSDVDISAASGVLPVSKGGTGVTTSTGTGATVQAVSPVFTGTPTAPTAAATVNTTQLATTAFVQAVNLADTGSAATAVKLKTARSIAISGGATGTATNFDGSGNITIPVTGLNMANANAGTLAVARGGTGTTTSTGTGANVQAASPTFTGTPYAPTASKGTDNTQIATTAFANAAVASPFMTSAYRFSSPNTQISPITFGWVGRAQEWALTLEANGNLSFNAYNNGTWIATPLNIDKSGNAEFGGRLVSNGLNNRAGNYGLWQTGDLGNSFVDWNGSAISAVQVDCPRNDSAYMLWRATKWGQRHLAAMHVFAYNSDTGEAGVSMAVANGAGGLAQGFRWMGAGDYVVHRNIVAGGSITPNSDIRLKNVIGRIEDPMEKIRGFESIIYTRKDIDNGTRYGYSAQSVEAVMPEAIVRSKPMENQKEFIPDEVLSVDYNGVSVLHGAALVEHDDEIKALKAEIELLKQMVSTLTNK